jgi:serine/threonine protein kinase
VSLLKLSFALLLWLLLFSGVEAEPKMIVVHSDPPCQVEDAQGKPLSLSGKPFNLPESVAGGEEVTLRLVAEGRQVKVLTVSARELANVTRLPPEGSYKLAPRREFPMVLVLCGLLGISALTYWLQRRRQLHEDRRIDRDGFSFQTGELLGQGGTSIIYTARAPGYEDKSLAVKILKPELAADPESRARFVRSLQDSLKLRHENLVELYTSGTNSQGAPYLLMEHLEGQTLLNYLLSDPLPSEAKILDIVIPLCDALIYLHGAGIVHRDVKPDNVYLTQEGKIKLMDLETSRGELSEDLTKTGIAIGTPNYIAPEQAKGKPCPQSDQYALGVLLFELLTGERPFNGPDAVAVIREHLESPAPSLCRIAPRVTLLQQAVVHRMLNKRPDQRFADMATVKQAILDAFNEDLLNESTATSA